MKINPVTLIDGYKCDHKRQYPDNTEIIFSNLTARSTRRPNTDKVVFAGLQYFVKEYLIKQWNENFFYKPIDEVIAKFSNRINNYLGPNDVGEQHIRDLHALGHLPVVILALPEGSEHALKVPSLVLWNTDERFGWFTNYLETILSTSVWGMCTSATTAHQYKKLLTKYAAETVGNTDFVPWQGHDFSFRGMFGMEAACMSGAAHLFSFTGTDTIPAIDFLEQYYNADATKELVGGSVAATEHSVMCAGGADDEIGTFRRLINQVYPKGIVSIVSDTWDYWNTLTNIALELKSEIMQRDGRVVFRPDTGDPVKVVVGDVFEDYSDDCDSLDEAKDYAQYMLVGKVGIETPHGEYGEWQPTTIFKYKDVFYKLVVEIDWNRYDEQYYYIDGNRIVSCEPVELVPEQKGSIECLWEVFGGKVNDKGFKELDPHVGLIYGDSITLERAQQICEGLKRKGFASTNIVFGIGSFTYQYATRDTDGYAVKATYAKINGADKEIFKSPKGAEFKKSAKGLTAVYKNDKGEFYLKDQATWEEVNNCEFVKVFENSQLIKDWTLQQVRNNLAQYV
jgi:nicotinamide phosphoribosyltransferase